MFQYASSSLRSARARGGAISAFLATLGATSLLVAGCGAESHSQPTVVVTVTVTASAASEAPEEGDASPRPIDACGLLSRAEAEKIAATKLVTGGSYSNDDSATCRYTGPTSGPTAQVEVIVGDGAKKLLDIDRELGHRFSVVSNVGDECLLEDFIVFVRKDGVWAALNLVRLDDPRKYDKALTKGAQLIIDRL